jgi:hypothetical protein
MKCVQHECRLDELQPPPMHWHALFIEFQLSGAEQMPMPVFIQSNEVHPMTQQIDKNKLLAILKQTPTKELLYLQINPVEPRSLQNALKELERFVGKGGAEVVVMI